MSTTGDHMSPGGSRILEHDQASDFEPARGRSHVAAISHERRTRSAPPRATAMLIAYGENPSSRNRAV